MEHQIMNSNLINLQQHLMTIALVSVQDLMMDLEVVFQNRATIHLHRIQRDHTIRLAIKLPILVLMMYANSFRIELEIFVQ